MHADCGMTGPQVDQTGQRRRPGRHAADRPKMQWRQEIRSHQDFVFGGLYNGSAGIPARVKQRVSQRLTTVSTNLLKEVIRLESPAQAERVAEPQPRNSPCRSACVGQLRRCPSFWPEDTQPAARDQDTKPAESLAPDQTTEQTHAAARQGFTGRRAAGGSKSGRAEGTEKEHSSGEQSLLPKRPLDQLFRPREKGRPCSITPRAE